MNRIRIHNTDLEVSRICYGQVKLGLRPDEAEGMRLLDLFASLGGNFVDTVMNGGLMYVLYGFIITTIPLIIMGIVARLYYKENYLLLMGIMAGATTDPPALAYSTQAANNDIPSIGYSTVYPLSMFLRIVTAQIIILMLCS